MKRYPLIHKIHVLLAILVGLLITGCNSEEQAGQREITFVTQLVAEIDGALLEVPINASGAWTAELTDGAEDWALLSPTQGEGSMTLLVGIDPIERDEPGRNGTLRLTCGKQVTTIPITQLLQYQGEPVSNSFDYSKITAEKGLGCGYDPYATSTLNMKKYQIFNLNTMMKLAQECGEEYAYLYSESPQAGIVSEYRETHGSEDKDDTLAVHVKLDVGFSIFTLSGEGHYVSNEDRFDSTSCMRIGAQVSSLLAETNCLDAMLMYDEAVQKEADGETLMRTDELSKLLFTRSFLTTRDEVIDAFDNHEEKIPTAVKNLITKFGLGVTDRNVLGGSLALKLQLDSLRTQEYSSLEKAQLQVDMKAYLLNINAGAGLAMKDSLEEHLRHSKFEYTIMGGSAATRSEVVRQLGRGDFSGVGRAVQDWMSSIKVDNDKKVNNTEMIATQLYPIWNLFPDRMKEGVKEMVIRLTDDKEGILKNIE